MWVFLQQHQSWANNWSANHYWKQFVLVYDLSQDLRDSTKAKLLLRRRQRTKKWTNLQIMDKYVQVYELLDGNLQFLNLDICKLISAPTIHSIKSVKINIIKPKY